jgi:hypothetical protein
VFWDDNSLTIERDTVVEGWVKLEYTTPRNVYGQVVISRMTHRAVNCATGRYWIMEDWLNLKNGGDPIQLAITGNEQQWQKAPPSSEAEMTLDALCYATKSSFGEAWDTVKEAYESPKANVKEIDDIGPETLKQLNAVPGPQDIQFKDWVGETALDSGHVSQHANLIIVSNSRINFITWDDDLKKYLINGLPLDQVTKAALVRGGNYEQLKQIQLITPTSKTVISFSTGEDSLAEDVFAKLMRAGVKEYSSSSFVHGYRITKPQ